MINPKVEDIMMVSLTENGIPHFGFAFNGEKEMFCEKCGSENISGNFISYYEMCWTDYICDDCGYGVWTREKLNDLEKYSFKTYKKNINPLFMGSVSVSSSNDGLECKVYSKEYDDMLFQTIDGKYKFIISEEIIKKALSDIKSKKVMTGGIIIGRYSDNLNDAIVSEITSQPIDSKYNKKDKTFYRGTYDTNKFLDFNWQSKKNYYLGEWIYSPKGLDLSEQTIKTMKEFSADEQMHCPEPILLTLTKNDISVHIFPKDEDPKELHFSKFVD